MMNLIVGNKDLSQLVGQITWSGDTKQVARKLQFTIARRPTDYYLAKVSIAEGDPVSLKKDGAALFSGIVFDIDKSSKSNTFTYVAFDFMFYIQNNEVNRIIDTTAEGCAALVCEDLGVTLGSAVATGIHVYIPALGKPGYEVIMAGYTEAAKVTGRSTSP